MSSESHCPSSTRWIALLIAGTIAFPAASAQAQEKSLYERLGGLAPISVVVSDFIDALVHDTVLNANTAIDEARKRTPGPYLNGGPHCLACADPA